KLKVLKPNEIIQKLPYSEPFLFVDSIYAINDSRAEGGFTFRKELAFYDGHFKDKPVTPGVILTECCAQIGLVCFGIYLIEQNQLEASQIAMTSSQMEFLKPVFPGETVRVVSEKVYFRFGKLKCKVKMFDATHSLVCQGTLSGMIVKDDAGK
ncbi:MAG: FabA/FabZ family ACP-dehydratase, partial [Bacteroidota bacterium]